MSAPAAASGSPEWADAAADCDAPAGCGAGASSRARTAYATIPTPMTGQAPAASRLRVIMLAPVPVCRSANNNRNRRGGGRGDACVARRCRDHKRSHGRRDSTQLVEVRRRPYIGPPRSLIIRRMRVLSLLILLTSRATASATELGVQGTSFTLDGKPAFLLGCSYYAGLGASDKTLRSDLDGLKSHGFNWVRVWATWAAFEHDVSAVDGATGAARQPYLDRLKHLVDECDKRGMVVDVTLSRGNGATGPARLQGLEAHRRVVETILEAVGDRKNWYLDLSNERNIHDKRFTPIEDLAELRGLVRRRDPKRLVTASHAGDVTRQDVESYLKTARLDFLSVHRPRDRKSPGQTAETTRTVRKWIEQVAGSGAA